jgi:hypothetical protein
VWPATSHTQHTALFLKHLKKEVTKTLLGDITEMSKVEFDGQ